MNLELRSFADRGVLAKERIIFKALADIDVGEYIILRSKPGKNGKGPVAGNKIAYWFPDLSVSANDQVVLYTKKGVRSSKESSSGGTIYFLYWGREESLWAEQSAGVVIAKILDWDFETRL